MQVRHLRCPNCGAALDADEAQQVVKCAYCKHSFHLLAPAAQRPVEPPPSYHAPPAPPTPTDPLASKRKQVITALIVGSILFGVIPGVISLVVGSATMIGQVADMGSQVSSTEWRANASQHRGQNGTRVSYQCPAGGSGSPVWGSGPYTDDSSVCTAAVHAGVITFEQGGSVQIEIRAGQGSYGASAAHGVTTGSWGAFDGSFVVVGSDPTPAPPEPGVQSATWSTSPGSFRGSNGRQLTYRCPSGGSPKPVWGSGPYTDDSSVCTAAVHAGKITFARGGTVRIEIRAGQGSYRGSVAHGVTTGAWGAFEGSFAVIDAKAEPK